MHAQTFLVVGFIDASFKWHGTWQVTYFPEDKQYMSAHLPSKEVVAAYAESLGYTIKHRDKFSPVHRAIGEGLEYCGCDTCFPNREVISTSALI